MTDASNGGVRTIGIIGGGQLGRMLALAAADLGFDVGILDPDADAPAVRVAAFHIEGGYDDEGAVARLAARSDVVTYEFENVSPDALAGLPAVHPSPRALAISQDRLDEKTALADLSIATAPHAPVERDAAAIAEALAKLGGRGILKTRRMGYDGKGQVRLPAVSPTDALASVGDGPLILEGLVGFAAEMSVIGVRASDGTTATYDPARNVHVDGILHTSSVPSGLGLEVEEQARRITVKLMEALDYVGAIGVEFFVLPADEEADAGRLLVNEFAPRVHNSGHWTDGGALTSQFENHVRAVAGLPLGATTRMARATMENLVGMMPDAGALAAERDTRVVLYGKREARPGRKMGHVTRLRPFER